mmetsp:Transcript_25585/g.54360  ORF Transcript_25585/g.54360 Transcript_25585/m.54360 type:complete len:345 (-) Transcript_25585:127-1161(-)
MATTYNTRLLHLTSRLKKLPVVVIGNEHKRKRVRISDKASFATPVAPPTHPETMPSSSASSKRPPPPAGYFYARVAIAQHHHRGDDSTAAKRRRQNEELRYAAAANVHEALTDAGHPPASFPGEGALSPPPGSVDASGARVMTASEFDRMEAGETTTNEGDDKATQYDDPNGDVSAMYMVASLVQSTRGYYNFEGAADDATKAGAANESKDDDRRTNDGNGDMSGGNSIAQAYIDYNSGGGYLRGEKAPSEDSENLSSWTPSSEGPSNELHDNRRKNIDNDNRSDGQSSCDGGGEEEEGGGSSSSSSTTDSIDISCSNQGSPGLYPRGQKRREPLGHVAFSIVG